MGTITFSWKLAKQRSIDTKLRRAHTQIKAKHPDLAKAHPAWIKEYTSVKKFTECDIAIKEEMNKLQDQTMLRREKVKGAFATGGQIV